jgi:osmotically-inducible protein OsmY
MSHDSQLQHAVLAALEWEPSVDASHIGVTADQAVVTLSGHVPTYAQKQAAEAAARGVRGVKAVVERIEIQASGQARRSDERIAAAAIDRLDWNASIPEDTVKIKVERGWVTLAGELDWNYQRLAAEQEVRALHGVTGLTNAITLRPSAVAANISDNILHALHRSWFFDTNTIKVTAQDGRVTLSGSAASPHDRQVAAETAWGAPGVTDVENKLIVREGAT